MSEVVELSIDNPDSKEVRRRERAAMKLKEKAAIVHDKVKMREAELAHAEERVARAEQAGMAAASLWLFRDQVRAARSRLNGTREGYRQAEGRAQAAWDDYMALFGGDLERERRWVQMREANRFGMTREAIASAGWMTLSSSDPTSASTEE